MSAAVLWLLAAMVLPGSAAGSGTVYAVGTASNSVSQLRIGAGGELSALTPLTVPAGSDPLRVAVTPDGRHVYVANREEDTVSQYSVDPGTGALTPKDPDRVATGWQPFGIAVHPDGRSVYVTNYQDDTVSQYDVDPATGVLTPKTPPVADTERLPWGVVIAPDGTSAYVTDAVGNAISQFDVDPETGVLSPKTPPFVATPGTVFAIAISPDGKSVYATNSINDAILQYDVDPETGTLAPKTPASAPAGSTGLIAIAPDGRSAYVPEQTERRVWQYDIDAETGVLSPKSPPTVPAGHAPWGVAVSADGGHAYVTNAFSSSISQYDIDPVTGGLTPMTPATVAIGVNPHGIVIGMLPRGYARPRSATPLHASLVPAYRPCTNPNSTHGEPLAYGSCAPPAGGSSLLTVGTPDANGRPPAAVGYMRLDVCRDTLCASGDVSIRASITDVRVTAGLRDYAGDLQGVLPLRITDRDNGLSGERGTDPATVSDARLTFAVPCTPTPDSLVGSTCSVSTTANTIVPGAVREGLRAIWELGQLEVHDGGPDGTASTDPNGSFLRQGVFVP